MAFKPIFDRDFKYRNADRTDVRLTFRRIRRQQQNWRRELMRQAISKIEESALAAQASADQAGASLDQPV